MTAKMNSRAIDSGRAGGEAAAAAVNNASTQDFAWAKIRILCRRAMPSRMKPDATKLMSRHQRYPPSSFGSRKPTANIGIARSPSVAFRFFGFALLTRSVRIWQ